MNEKISIIIPTLNEEKFLPKLLESLSYQTDQDFEVIIVDGRSKDKTVDVARSFVGKVPRLSVVVSDKRGVSYQKNLGATKAAGEWILFIDADAIVYPYAIDRVRTYISSQNTEFFTPWFSPDASNSSDVSVSLLAIGVYEGGLMMKKPLAAVFVGVKKERFFQVGTFDETRTFGEDHDLTQKLEKIGVPLFILRETLYIQSFRRYREKGRMKFLQAYAKGLFSVLFTSQTPKKMEGYELGGQIYWQKKKSSSSLLKTFRVGLKKLMREMVG
jgi:glycosyltransferase involved in cell wall biosynthesis